MGIIVGRVFMSELSFKTDAKSSPWAIAMIGSREFEVSRFHMVHMATCLRPQRDTKGDMTNIQISVLLNLRL